MMRSCKTLTKYRRFMQLLSLGAVIVTVSIILTDVHTARQISPVQHKQKPGGHVIVVFSRTDQYTCGRWSTMYPDNLIVLVGHYPEQRNQSHDFMMAGCLYVDNVIHSWEESLIALRIHHREVVVVNDDISARGCISRLKTQLRSGPSQYRVIYDNPSEPIYRATRHFGCGGIQNHAAVSPYSLCDAPRVRGPVIGVTSDSKTCDSVYPVMALAPGVHVLYQLKCGWVPNSAIWTLPFLGVSHVTEDLVVSMMAEKLLWAVGGKVEVTGPTLYTALSERRTDTTLQDVSSVLASIQCEGSSFLECAHSLSEDLQAHGYLSDKRKREIRRWFSSLNQNGYEFPSKSQLEPKCLNRTLQSFVTDEDLRSPLGSNIKGRRAIQSQLCRSRENILETHNFAIPWKQFDVILLIVTYNTPGHYSNIRYFETIYRQFFPHILYCGPGTPDLTDDVLRNYTFTFMSFSPTPQNRRDGSLHYECLIQASKMGYNVKGFLQSSDDIFMNMHQFRHFDTNNAWYYQFSNLVRVDTFKHISCESDECETDDRNNQFWHQFRNDTFNAFTELNGLRTPAAKLCNRNRQDMFGGIDWHARVISDTSYIPARYVSHVVSVLEVFLRHELYLEIALPTAIYCIIPFDQFDHIYMDLHNLAKPARPPYSHRTLKPTFPDLVILSILENVDLFKCNPRSQPYVYISPQHLQGMAIFHGYKLDLLTGQDEKLQRLFCDILAFFGDVEGQADTHITRYQVRQYCIPPRIVLMGGIVKEVRKGGGCSWKCPQ